MDSGKKIIFGGAPFGTPWGTLGEIVKQSLGDVGYDVEIEPEASRGRCPGLIESKTVDLGATQALLTKWAYDGRHEYSSRSPIKSLRVIATIMMPAWLGVAVRWETGITSLADIAKREIPVRVAGGRNSLYRHILDYYGLSKERIESFGGYYHPPTSHEQTADIFRRGAVDLMMENVYASYTPEAVGWYEAATAMNLRFLPLPDDLLASLASEFGGLAGHIPARLFPGVTAPVASLYRPWQLIFCHEDTPEDLTYLLAQQLDRNRHLFRATHIPYSYDNNTVATDHGIPLHPSAKRYYDEHGYPSLPPSA